MHGQWEDIGQQYLRLDRISEKPAIEYAQENLKVRFKNTANNNLSKGEIQLTDALEEVLQSKGMLGCRIKGKSFDVGLPQMYADTLLNYNQDQ